MFSFFKKKPLDIPSVWNHFKNWMSKNASHLLNDLNPPTTDVELKQLESKIGIKLPEDYSNFLKIHNGQKKDSEGLIDSEEILSTERILEEWTVWKELLEKGDFEESESTPSKGIRKDWWSDKWIPITYDGSGNHYCIDLDPTSEGVKGQIIRMWHDSSERELISKLFKEWISRYVINLEKGHYVYSEEWGGIINKDEV